VSIALKKYNHDEEKVLILISSLMAWNNTPNKLKEIKEGNEEENPDDPDNEAEGDEAQDDDEA